MNPERWSEECYKNIKSTHITIRICGGSQPTVDVVNISLRAEDERRARVHRGHTIPGTRNGVPVDSDAATQSR